MQVVIIIKLVVILVMFSRSNRDIFYICKLSSNTSEISRIWHSRCFNNIHFFFLMTMRHVCFWQHQFTSIKIMGIKEIPYGLYFLCGKVSLGQECGLALTADSMLSKLDKQDMKVTAELCQYKIELPFRISFFKEKNVRYVSAYGRLKMEVPTLQRNLV